MTDFLLEGKVEGLSLLTRGYSLLSVAEKNSDDKAWYEQQLRRYSYLLGRAKEKLVQKQLEELEEK